MESLSTMDENMSNDMLNDDCSSSDDELVCTDDYDEDFGDLIILNCFVHNTGSTVGRTPCRTSMLTGNMYMLEILNGHPDGTQHDTVSLVIGFSIPITPYTNGLKRVLRAVCSFGTEIIRPTTQDVVHERILHKYPFFKDCIGAIDGTHVAAWAPASRQTSFRGRNTNITQNVMLVCDFDMRFSFVYSGWEGTANDSRVFVDAVTRSSNNFPMPRGDQFYLVDSGYPNMPGFLAPYRGQRYHLCDYVGRGRLRGKEELFNYRHSSCRNIIKRCIGVLKARFPILKFITNYPLTRQRQIPTACCAIHNFIQQEHALDTLFAEYSGENMVFQDIPKSSQDQEAIHFDASQTAQMGQVRDEIATQMWNDYSRSRT
ncbi:putative harbinger transposase-derived nuclease [Abeliophyllum distichum]|uniref:Harbinger transposase-derived nuclease n=1 Tax=Abeliophyllum distichum TaxID=126358 RepID=A0ABD1REI1_9LAMI